MENYELFGEFINKSKQIRQFCEKDENLLFEALRMSIPSDGVRKYLTSVGKEIDLVLDFIEKLETDREANIATLLRNV
jgi:hypothetical protein